MDSLLIYLIQFALKYLSLFARNTYVYSGLPYSQLFVI